MSSKFQSFDASPMKAFIESPLHARGGGVPACFCVHPTSGLYLSLDAGVTWALKNATPLIRCLAAVNGVLIGGTYESSPGYHGHFKRSTDRGANWTPYAPAFAPLHSICYVGDDTFIATGCDDEASSLSQGGIFRSTDSGASWAAVSGTSSFYGYWVANVGGGVCFCGGRVMSGGVSFGTIWRSTNSGATWTAVYTSTGSTRDRVESVCGSNDGVCLAGTVEQATGYYGSILRSTNGGATWAPLAGNYGYVYAVEHLGTDVCLAGVRYDATHGCVYRSEDNGVGWSNVQADAYGIYRIRKFSASKAFASDLWLPNRRSVDAGETWDAISDLAAVGDMRDWAVELAA